jgi:hypothetical protein
LQEAIGEAGQGGGIVDRGAEEGARRPVAQGLQAVLNCPSASLLGETKRWCLVERINTTYSGPFLHLDILAYRGAGSIKTRETRQVRVIAKPYHLYY